MSNSTEAMTTPTKSTVDPTLDVDDQAPEGLVLWMKKFGVEVKHGQAKKVDREGAVKEAEEVAKLLAELQSQPDFNVWLAQFGELALLWEKGIENLEEYKQGTGTHEERVVIRKKLKDNLSKLKILHVTLSEQKEQSPDNTLRELLAKRDEAGDLDAELRRRIEGEKVAISGAELLVSRFAKADRLAESASSEKSGNTEEDGRAISTHKMLLATLDCLIQDQRDFILNFDNQRTIDERKKAVDSMSAKVYRNLEFAGQVQIRDEDRNEIEACLKRCDIAVQNEAVDELEKLVDKSRSLMSTQAIFLESKNDVDVAKDRCELFYNTWVRQLNDQELKVFRIKKVNEGFNDADVATKFVRTTDALEKARAAAEQRIQDTVEGKPLPEEKLSLLDLVQKEFESSSRLVQELTTELDLALKRVDQVKLKVHDIQPLLEKALLAPEVVPGRAGLKEDFEKAWNDANTTTNEKLFRLGEIQNRCMDVASVHAEGVEKGGGNGNYWAKRDAAEKALVRERTALAQSRKLMTNAQKKLADKCLTEAELHYERDDENGFDQVTVLTDELEKVRNNPPSGDKAKFKLECLRVQPIIDAATKIDSRFAGHMQEVERTDDVKALKSIHKDASLIVSQAYAEWTAAIQGAAELTKFARRLADRANSVETGSDNSAEKKSEMTPQELLAMYDSAVRDADRGDYPKAQKALQGFVKEAEKLQEEKKQLATAVLESAAKPKDVNGQHLSWSGPSADVKDKSYGFNTTRDAMRYTAGAVMNRDGTLVISKELDEIGKFLAFKLKMFRKLCDLGENPLEVAPKVFHPVPENFWPPDAVRVVVAYRAAEQEFEEERVIHEAQELCRNPDKLTEVVKDREAAEQAQQAKQESLKKHFEELKKKGAELGELAKASMEEILYLGTFLSLSNYMESTDNYGVADIGKFDASDTDGVGGSTGLAGDGSGIASSLVATGQSAYDLMKAINSERMEKGKNKFKSRKEDDVLSPVKAKIVEYERNRAIAQLINNATDLVLNVLSGGGHIPGMDVAMDVKGLVLALLEAGRYFAMLAQSKSDEGNSKRDPDSITYLALSRQAEEEGIAGGIKLFEAAIKIGRLTGDAVQLSGQAAPVGFAINVSMGCLELGGKVVFQVYAWHDASKQEGFIKRARQNPPDYQAMAEVFSNTRKYARYLIAWGCLNNDPWARNWVMSRGLSDEMLDHPETGTKIIREYINTTQEGFLGDTQSDAPETFGESNIGKVGKWVKDKAVDASGAIEDKIRRRDRDIKNQFFDPVEIELTEDSFEANLEKAYAAGLYRGNKDITNVKKQFKALKMVSKAFELVKRKESASDKDDVEYEEKASDYRVALDRLREALADCNPTANPDGATAHEAMKMYLGDLLMMVAEASTNQSKETEIYWQSSLRRQAKEALLPTENEDSEDEREVKLQKEISELKQKKMDEAAHQLRESNAIRSEKQNDRIDKLLKSTKFATPLGNYLIHDAASQKKILDDAVARLGLDKDLDASKVAAISDAITNACAVAQGSIRTGLSSLSPDTSEKDFRKKYDAQCKTVGKEFAKILNNAYSVAVADQVEFYTWKANDTPTPFSDLVKTMTCWSDAIQQASDEKTGGWVPDQSATNKVQSALKDFCKQYTKIRESFQIHSVDDKAWGKWNIAVAYTEETLDGLPCLTKFGTDHAEMREYVNKCLKGLRDIRDQMRDENKKIRAIVNWNPKPSDFDHFSLTVRGYELAVDLCMNYHLKKPKEKVDGLFKNCEKAQVDWEDIFKPEKKATAEDRRKKGDAYKLALSELSKGISAIVATYDKKHPRFGESHEGFYVYCDSVNWRTRDIVSDIEAKLNQQ